MQSSNVRVTPAKPQKYEVVTTHTPGEQILLWGNPDIQWHKDIVDEMERAGWSIDTVHGGGWILVAPDTQTVYVWGKSDRYGLTPKSILKTILSEVFPEHKIFFDVEPAGSEKPPIWAVFLR